ncbi:outer membrane beta-barrel protein [Phenylobacterium sp.]|uniref:OmpA family protein n=1 Tax=Phenylobacterium sp. TaxID=1871053 RepID=UPI00301B89CD
MKLKLLAGAAMAAAFAASAASAQTGWYGAVDLGYHWPESLEATSSNNAANGSPYEWDFNQEKDWAGFARVGYQLTDNWRVELEVGYRGGDFDSVNGVNQAVIGLCTPGVVRTAAAPGCGAPDGDISSWTFMGNIIYDFLPGSTISPFLGAGIGANHVSVDVVGQFSNVTGAITAANPAIQNLTIDDSDTAFAYQGIAGLAWRVTDKLRVDLTYRYLSGGDIDFVSTGSGALQPGVFSGKYKDQSVTLGLRYIFAADAPPPPPPPPAYEARQFIVYFPFDQYVITPEAQAVINDAANYASAGNATRVVVVGHTDTSGSPAYNVRLSERRAKAVADALVGAGVNQTALSVDWKGETMPAVATGDGVKEPLNRRSTIDINF